MQENTHTKALLECIEPESTIWFWNERKPEKMPYTFMKKKDNFSEWFNNQHQREEITKRFKDELSDGHVTDIYLNKIRQSWEHESYYQSLINWYTEQHREVWKNSLSKQTEISKTYPFLREWGREGRTLEEEPRNAWETYLYLANQANEASAALKVLKSYCEAALWFIHSSKNIVENWESVKITTSTDENQKKEIYISPENIEPIYNALVPYFREQETNLRQLLEGKTIEGKVRFNESAKVLCNTFNTLHGAGRINTTIGQIKIWLRKYFQANRAPYDLSESNTERSFQEKIEMKGQILLPTIKGLITFDKS